MPLDRFDVILVIALVRQVRDFLSGLDSFGLPLHLLDQSQDLASLRDLLQRPADHGPSPPDRVEIAAEREQVVVERARGLHRRSPVTLSVDGRPGFFVAVVGRIPRPEELHGRVIKRLVLGAHARHVLPGLAQVVNGEPSPAVCVEGNQRVVPRRLDGRVEDADAHGVVMPPDVILDAGRPGVVEVPLRAERACDRPGDVEDGLLEIPEAAHPPVVPRREELVVAPGHHGDAIAYLAETLLDQGGDLVAEALGVSPHPRIVERHVDPVAALVEPGLRLRLGARVGVSPNRAVDDAVGPQAAAPALPHGRLADGRAFRRTELRHVGAGVGYLVQRVYGGEVVGGARPPVPVAERRPVADGHVGVQDLRPLALQGLEEGVLGVDD